MDIAKEKARTRELYLISKKGKYEVRAIDSEAPKETRLRRPASQEVNSEMKEFLSSIRLTVQNQQELIYIQQETLRKCTEESSAVGCRRGKSKSRNGIICWNCGRKGPFSKQMRLSG